MQSNNLNNDNSVVEGGTANQEQENQQYAPLMDPPAELLQEASAVNSNQVDSSSVAEEAKSNQNQVAYGQVANQEMLNPNAPQFEPFMGTNGTNKNQADLDLQERNAEEMIGQQPQQNNEMLPSKNLANPQQVVLPPAQQVIPHLHNQNTNLLMGGGVNNNLGNNGGNALGEDQNN